MRPSSRRWSRPECPPFWKSEGLVKTLSAFLGVAFIGVVAWVAAGPNAVVHSSRIAAETTPAARQAEEIPASPNRDTPRAIIVPVAGVDRGALRDTFNDVRGTGRHEAIDIMAPRGTPVIAA